MGGTNNIKIAKFALTNILNKLFVVFCKIYFWIITVFTLIAYALAASRLTIVDWLSLLSLIAGIAGLYGYGYNKNIGPKKYWSAISFLSAAYFFIYSFYLDPRFGGLPSTDFRGMLITALIGLPAFLALFLYTYNRADKFREKKSKTSKKQLVIKSGLLLLLFTPVFIFLYLTVNPYTFRELTLQQPSSEYKTDSIKWVDPNINYISIYEEHPPIAGLPTNQKIHSTNVDSSIDYQFALTGTRDENQNLYWRKNSFDKWNKINLPYKYVSPEGFIIKNGQVYLVVTVFHFQEIQNFDTINIYFYLFNSMIADLFKGGDYSVYLIDLPSGRFIKQFSAENDMISISPDKKKMAYLRSHGGIIFGSDHSVVVWDFDSDKKTPVTTITEADPGSGISFGFEWSEDSNFLKTEGSTLKNPSDGPGGNTKEFVYIYAHGRKELFDASE